MDENLGTSWSVKAEKPPTVATRQWYWLAILGGLLLFMALMQLFSFSSLSGTFEAENLKPGKFWAALIVFAELLGAASFFKLKLSHGFRAVSKFLALAAAVFWVVVTLRTLNQVSYVEVLIRNKYQQPGVGFFGGLFYQMPGWLPVIEAILLACLIFYVLLVLMNEKQAKSNIKKKRK